MEEYQESFEALSDKAQAAAEATTTDDSLALSFDYYLRGDCPDEHIKSALRNLISSRMTADDQKSESETESLAKIRWLIATNPNTPSVVLDHLIVKGDWRLLERIAEHPRLSAGSLAKLAFHESAEVRAAVAENPHTATQIVEMLVTDENPDVRYRLAENHNLDSALLEILSEDENPYVAHRAQMTLSRRVAAPVVAAQFYRTPWQERKQSSN